MAIKNGLLRVAIVGTGAFAQGLGAQAVRSGAVYCYSLCFASRKVNAGSTARIPGLPDIPVVNTQVAVSDADIVILAVPSSSHKAVANQLGHLLAGKIVIDVSNPYASEDLSVADKAALDNTESNASSSSGLAAGCQQTAAGLCAGKADGCAAVRLSNLLPASCRVVKAFNSVSAYAMIHAELPLDTLRTVVCADDKQALVEVKEFAQAAGFQVQAIPSLSHAAVLERAQQKLLTSWQGATWVMLAFIVVIYFWHHVPLWIRGTNARDWQPYIINASMWHRLSGWWAMWGLTATYLPGLIATLVQLVKGSTSLALPRPMRSWLNMRKQLGLLSLWVVGWHLILSACLYGPAYFGVLYDRSPALVPAVNGSTVDRFGFMPAGTLAPSMKASLNTMAGIGASSSSSSSSASSHNMSPAEHAAMLAAGNSSAMMAAGNSSMRSMPANGTATAAAPVASSSVEDHSAHGRRLAHTGHAPASVSASAPRNVNASGSFVLQQADIYSLGQRMNYKGDACLMLGVLATMLLLLPSLASVPGIGGRLNWREWQFLQSHVGWFAFAACVGHTMMSAHVGWPMDWGWRAGQILPTVWAMAAGPGMVMCILKLLTMLPPVSWRLSAIRRGTAAVKGSEQFAVYCEQVDHE